MIDRAETGKTSQDEPGDWQGTALSPQLNWRHALLFGFRYVLLSALLVMGVAVFVLARSTELRILGVVVVLSLPPLHFLLAWKAMSYRFRARVVVGILAGLSIVTYPMVGLNPGPALLAGVSIVGAILLLGRYDTTVLLGSLLVVLLCMTGALWTGWWDGPPTSEYSSRDPVIWLRVTIVSGVLWSTTAYAVFFVVTTVEHALREREEALRRLQQETAQRVAAERARGDAEATAQQLQKLESLGQLAAGVAHDFNNALLVVRGWNDILRNSDAPDTREKGAEAIEQATEQAGKLARELLTFARQEVRRPRHLLIDEIIAATVTTIDPLLPPDIHISVDTVSDSAIFADEAQIQQLLFNLIINARDAMPDGGKIALRCRCIASGDIAKSFPNMRSSDQWVELCVQDNGPGIDEAIRDRVLEPFFTTKGTGEGTGLGLSTVFGIVTQSSGHIDVANVREGGARITVYLPAVDASRVSSEPLDPIAGHDALTPSVFVLEDDPLARDLIEFNLRRHDIPIQVATDGDEALRLLSKTTETFDVLCTDAVFPGAPLDDVIAAFHANSPAGRVLICSGYVRENLTLKGLEAGDYAFMAKPFTGAQLVDKIRRIAALGVQT
ncbi:MAG: ATP-binding protein [Gammaproteobacteria bacterium]